MQYVLISAKVLRGALTSFFAFFFINFFFSATDIAVKELLVALHWSFLITWQVACAALYYVLECRYRSSFLSNHHNTILNMFPSFHDSTLAITWTGGKLNNHKVKVCTYFQRYEKYTKMALSFCRKHLYNISLTLSRFPWLYPRLETFLPIWHLCMKGNERQMSPWWSLQWTAG